MTSTYSKYIWFFGLAQVELFESDLENIKMVLNSVSAADNSPISLYEYFHISPIKVCPEYNVLKRPK